MRVVAGTAGGIRLTVPKTITRPTMDKVRGAIFSSLGESVVGSRVLDLYAGSGAFGLEALSRGAAAATFVDNHRSAVQAIRDNLERSRLVGDVRLADAIGFLRKFSHGAERYDFIFADPPYTKRVGDLDLASSLMECDELRAALASGGTLVIESEARHVFSPAAVQRWNVLRSRVYGDTAVHYFSIAG